MNKLIYTLLMSDKHALICGPTGTGKSISIANELKNSFDNADYTYISLSFSA
jgi:MoxR-like ATPase